MRNRFMYYQSGLPGWARMGGVPGNFRRGMGRRGRLGGQCFCYNYNNAEALQLRASALEAELVAIRSRLEVIPAGGAQ